MSFFVLPTASPAPKTKNIRPISLAFAAVLVIMLVAQLFTFEEFPGLIASSWLLDDRTSSVVAASIVALELLALPFLLQMRLSPAMRVVSMVAGWLVVSTWLIVSLCKNVVGDALHSVLLGATIPLPEGWWSVLFCLALGILAVWASWGMWPIKAKSAK